MTIDESHRCPLCAAQAAATPYRTADRPQALGVRIRELSRREEEVFLLMAGGPSNRDLADALYLTERTVKAHISRILGKLGISRLQACLAAEHYHDSMCTEGQLSARPAVR